MKSQENKVIKWAILNSPFYQLNFFK